MLDGGVGGGNQLLLFCQVTTEPQLLIQLWFLFSDEGRAVFKRKVFLMPSGSGFRIVAFAERTASYCCFETQFFLAEKLWPPLSLGSELRWGAGTSILHGYQMGSESSILPTTGEC